MFTSRMSHEFKSYEQMFSSITVSSGTLVCEITKYVTCSVFLFSCLTRSVKVPRAQKAGWKTLGLLTYRVGLLMVWTLLALPGTVLNGPMFILASLISKKKAKGRRTPSLMNYSLTIDTSGLEALAGSVVKVAGRDVLATWKVLISLGVAPVLYGFYAFLATLVAIKAKAPLKWRIWTPFLVIVALPFMNYAALKFGEAGIDVLKYAFNFIRVACND
jgi:glycerol-3-phosphate O-acyltransferase/dihydroxyacetone phosphate acyltransferase